MDQDLLRKIATEYLVPLFSGAKLEEQAQMSTSREGLVAFINPISIAFKASKKDKYRLILTRRQSFSKSEAVVVPEYLVVEAFVEVVESMAEALESQLQKDLLSTFQRRVVARAISGGQDEDVVLSGIDQLAAWGTRLYERAPIAMAIGFRHRPQKTNLVGLREIAEYDFAPVVSNGYDTLLEFDFQGNFITHKSLSPNSNLPSFCPLRQVPIAEWTTVNQRRIALILNRLGEILVFRDQQLLFARRSGRWHFLTHDPVISQMAIPRNPEIRRAIYETCLDASFARTGACIGVVTVSRYNKWQALVDSQDHLGEPKSPKVRVIAKMVRNRRFHRLDRRLRQELTAIDGATILASDGQILAVGAIIKISGGSAGGGRLAAAKALSNLGLGIKVSQDGGISGFRASRDEAVFRIM